jgi:DNA (cytosine-5)-methyltransferase 1
MTAVSEKQILKGMSGTISKVVRTLPVCSEPEPKEDPAIASDVARTAARGAARHLALNFDQLWSRSRKPGAERPIDVVDMFSGCGGMSTGFSAVSGLIPSYRLAAAFDIDQVANKTYEANLGIAPFAEDISALARSKTHLGNILESAGRRDRHPWVLIGCAPCQGFSSHRNKAGHGDPRNSLFVDFARIAARLRPTAVVVENVPELLTDQYWPYVREARRTLEQAGYYVHISVHNMAEYGVPQERFRALILAMKRPFVPPHGFLGRGNYRTVRKAIGNLPRVKAGNRHPSDPMHYSAGHKESTLKVIRAVPKDGGNRPDGVGPECLRRAKEKNGRAAYEDVYGRLYWDRPSITVTAYARNPASGRYVHPEQDRGLTIREAALLQGFPQGYAFSGGLDQSFRQVGNAVPPVFAGFVATYLLGELAGTSIPSDRMEPGIERPVGSSFSRIIPALKAGHRDTNAPHQRTKEVG